MSHEPKVVDMANNITIQFPDGLSTIANALAHLQSIEAVTRVIQADVNLTREHVDEVAGDFITDQRARLYIGPNEPPQEVAALWLKTTDDFSTVVDLLYTQGNA